MRRRQSRYECRIPRAASDGRTGNCGLLRQSILKAAFAGKLVPQDPNDEPASVLLERIRAERAAKPRPARGRRTGGRSKLREGQLDLALDRGDTA